MLVGAGDLQLESLTWALQEPPRKKLTLKEKEKNIIVVRVSASIIIINPGER